MNANDKINEIKRKNEVNALLRILELGNVDIENGAVKNARIAIEKLRDKQIKK
ncbi:MAG: hypothetical protein J0L55_00535 [Caulobacterales bacterium]|nr:hypothetical protein [Caulobacterales bacterium]MCA0372239.1 hypothetical protein [Pseudomonadota bacterium]